jgi:hypothetical protein
MHRLLAEFRVSQLKVEIRIFKRQLQSITLKPLFSPPHHKHTRGFLLILEWSKYYCEEVYYMIVTVYEQTVRQYTGKLPQSVRQYQKKKDNDPGLLNI